MASSSRIAAAAASSTTSAAHSISDLPLCQDLPVGRITIALPMARGLDDTHVDAPVDAGIFPSVDTSGSAAALVGGVKDAPVDEGTLFLDTVEASY